MAIISKSVDRVLEKLTAVNFLFRLKSKLHPRIGHEGPEEEWWYTSYFCSSISALDGG
jgi:hypothetical protein